MAWKLGEVGHFGLSVRDPKAIAAWWVKNIGLRKAFEFEDGVAVESDAVTIVLHKGVPYPGTISHTSFHLNSMGELREALEDLWFHDPDGYRWELSVQNGAKEKH